MQYKIETISFNPSDLFKLFLEHYSPGAVKLTIRHDLDFACLKWQINISYDDQDLDYFHCNPIKDLFIYRKSDLESVCIHWETLRIIDELIRYHISESLKEYNHGK